MTGMPVVTPELGLVEQTPAMSRQRARGLRRVAPARSKRLAGRLAPAEVGCLGSLPPQLRRHPWARPAYGVLMWVSFEVRVAPALSLRQASPRRRPSLYGAVLSSPPTAGHRRAHSLDDAPDRPGDRLHSGGGEHSRAVCRRTRPR